MNAKHMVSGVVLLGMIVAGLAGTGEPARARIVPPPPPSTTFSYITDNPLSLEVMGTDFTPEGRVHIDLVESSLTFVAPDGSVPPGTPVPGATRVDGPPHVVASVDTTAAAPIDVPNGEGVAFTYPGGYFTTTLTAPPLPGCGQISFWMVATDAETGTLYTSDKTAGGTYCY